MKILNNKSNFYIFVFFAFILLLNTSCSRINETINESKESNEGKSRSLFGENHKKEVRIYFTKLKGKDEILFVPVKRKIALENSFVSDALKELLLGPVKQEEVQGIMTEIPVGTRLIKVEQSEDDILVDLSSQFVTGGGSAAMQLRYLQIYKTLSSIAPQKKIYLYVDGKPIKTIGGEGLEITQPLTKINDYTKVNETNSNVQP